MYAALRVVRRVELGVGNPWSKVVLANVHQSIGLQIARVSGRRCIVVVVCLATRDVLRFGIEVEILRRELNASHSRARYTGLSGTVELHATCNEWVELRLSE